MVINNPNYPKRLKRSESFLGVHFDFHAGDDNLEIGAHTTPEMIEAVIKQVKPDYIQCDCKGHRGFCSYPTKVGYAAPGVVKDALRIWREVTAKHGVALYMHYSGVWDTEALKHHPSWARIDEKGKRDKDKTSVFGPYVDKLLIPQFKELCDEYGVDGVWVDGECWATMPDYGKKVLAEFRAQTGIQDVPRKPGDPHFYEFMEFCREGFRRYVRHYVDAMHQHNPNFQIASNWAYSSFMPEPVTVAVDYISGDFPLQNSVNGARLEGRCMVHQGKPWDLMAWSFSGNREEHCFSTKNIAQLQQEAAVVLALGGGFQAYFQQKRDGSLSLWQMKLMAEVAKFCRARQRVCHRARPVPQIALLYAGKALYRKSTRLFTSGAWGKDLAPLQGVLNALLDAQNSVEITMEHHLTGRMGEYPLIVVPEWEYLEPSFKDELLSYVRNGGNLLVIGPKAAAMFQRELSVDFIGETQEAKPQWLEHGGWLSGLRTASRAVRLLPGARPFGKLYPQNDMVGPYEIAASIAECGKGKIAAIYFDFGERYVNGATATARDFLNALVRELFPKPMVEVVGSHHVDVVVNRIGDKLAVNLVNTSGPHADARVYTYDEVPPVGPLEITIRSGTKPVEVTLEPEGKALAYTWEDGEIKLTLPRLEIHEVIVVR